MTWTIRSATAAAGSPVRWGRHHGDARAAVSNCGGRRNRARHALGLAHVELAALNVATVRGCGGLLGFVARARLDEPETARAPGVAFGDDRLGLTYPHLGKLCLQMRSRRLKGQIPYEHLLPHDLAPSTSRPGTDESGRNCKGEKSTARTRRVAHRQRDWALLRRIG